ncbi:Ldh family oxidoreductase [Selenihalanaerobacter shriftii]|uniref:Malate/lactate/ureidoglycolate dehydrogenase, LDH2 family n=1 Tax=Selenihalanaerobacter shriftii TaxID=142842 RepID=A0A1T4JQ67_9FIRM|nr:Ldh family oxidoreductase [Selenihalanaerobacter shriftii]SJZ32382.1 Malate/lactate/ureidoglycolate dehydrogenase, LDH2 family [Selenihalanaerobacter shriftii]
MNETSEESVVKLDVRGLREFAESILQEVGLTEENAKTFADSLMYASLRGIDTHGISRLPIYVKRLEKGIMNSSPRPKFVRQSFGTGILSGDNGPGQINGTIGMKKAIEIAGPNGAGFVAIKDSNHFGAAAYYAKQALAHDMIGLAFTNSQPNMVPYGGGEPFFGTNPISAAIPTKQELPIIIDLATSKVARGNIILAAKEGEDIPEDWAVNSEGESTTNPKEALEGAVLPMSGAKGYSLAILVEVLSGILAGGGFSSQIKSLYNNFEEPQKVGHFVGVINPADFISIDIFKSQVDQMIREIKKIQPGIRFKEVFLPGELEEYKKKDRLQEGIPLTKGVVEDLKELQNQHGIELHI